MGFLLFHVENAAFQGVSGCENVLAGVQRIHTPALVGGTKLQRAFPVAHQPDAHGPPSAGEGGQGINPGVNPGIQTVEKPAKPKVSEGGDVGRGTVRVPLRVQ